MKRFILAFGLALVATYAMATASNVTGWQIYYEPSAGTVDHYTCTAYYRYDTQNPAEAATDNAAQAPIVDTTTTRKTSWASVTCTDRGVYPGGNGTTRLATISVVDIDPSGALRAAGLPGIEVIACIKAVDSNGGSSTCVNGVNFVPNDSTKPYSNRGSKTTATAQASAQ